MVYLVNGSGFATNYEGLLKKFVCETQTHFLGLLALIIIIFQPFLHFKQLVFFFQKP